MTVEEAAFYEQPFEYVKKNVRSYFVRGFSSTTAQRGRGLGTKYIDKDIDSIANQFDVYDKLGWYSRWRFRSHLSWLGEDRVSLGYLLEFEQELKKK